MSPFSQSSAGSDRPHPTRTLLILSLAALSFALAQTTLIPALAELMEEFHTDATGIAWVLTGYLISAAIFTPIFGRLGDMFGKRRLLVIALSIFAAGSTVSALGDSVPAIVAGRILQGVGGGIFPLCFGIIRDEFPPEKVSASVGLMSATLGIGGGIGLVVGGLIVDHASYHWIFWLGAAMAVMAAAAALIFVPESPNRVPAKVDYRGAAVLAVGLSVPMYAISEANNWGWTSTKTIGLILAGFVVITFWVWLQKRTREPLADVSLLAEPRVAMTNTATLLIGFGMFASFILIPQLVESPDSTGYGFGFSATQAGLVMLPAALMMLPAGPLSGHLGARFGNRVPLALGGLISGIGLIGLGLDHGSALSIVLWNVLSSIGVGLAYAAMPNLIMEAVPLERTGEATGFNTLIRSVGSSLGSQVTASILTGTILAATGFPTSDGFRTAFLVGAGVSIFAGLLALLIPRSGHRHAIFTEEIGAASVLPEPALAADER
ncbi:MAG TPA: MFS transporter [Solirubrobacterales bacterium]|nr:MFS transporter [Solirubrobacterales bacterium]HMU26006.1 MFS transporter [Solirubrobacterales bacterium]HMX70810.1 MFS transporter [Solirubrobacterales bacterium]HMY26207.1 MFS transporter [Solirubrobacterales bacterium]HNA24378.1 MFS transporter [Solirubrobacterales bacterium]